MSHFPERTEKNCLNCGAEVAGRYCQDCGQENLEPKETFLHLVTHFINDVTHFDGKFFSTLKFLLFRPGFLSAEYVRGRRMSYLHPIRMYVFTSAIFFIIFFSLIGDKSIGVKTESFKALSAQRRDLLKELGSTKDLDDRKDLLRDIYRKDTDVYRLSEVRNELAKDGFRLDGDTTGMAQIIAGIPADSLAWQQGVAAYKAYESNQDEKDKDAIAAAKAADASVGAGAANGASASGGVRTATTGTPAPGAYHYGGPGKAREDSLNKARAEAPQAPTGAATTAKAKDSANLAEDSDDSATLKGIQKVGTIVETADSSTLIGWGGKREPGTVEEYDRRQALMSDADKDGWLQHLVNRRMVILHQEYNENKKGFKKELTESVIHTFPKILFVSLPFFALLLRLLNLRRRKEILYVDHGIFTIHLYCASFIIILAMILVNKFWDLAFNGNLEWIPDMVLIILFFFYQYKAMHNFYRQGRAKTVVKMVILDFFAMFILTFTVVFFVLWTFLEM